MDLGLTDRVYLVTGGTRGLGAATARALVDDGARVVVSSRDQASVDASVADLGERAIGLVADNADPAAPGLLLDAARSKWGRVDGALVSVGGPPPGKPSEVDDDAWRAGFDSVFLGGVRLCREVAAALGHGGSIALVLSTSVRNPIPGLAVSNGLRPGLAMFAKDLADEVGARGIRVNGLLPGRIATDRVQELDEATGDPAAAKARQLESIPLGRYGEPTSSVASRRSYSRRPRHC